MACERWCFNRGCDGVPRRWPCALLLVALALSTFLGSSLAMEQHDHSYYTYAIAGSGKSSSDYRSAHFSFVSDDDEVVVRRRRAPINATFVTTEQAPPVTVQVQSTSEQPPQQAQQQPPPQQQQQQQPQPQPQQQQQPKQIHLQQPQQQQPKQNQSQQPQQPSQLQPVFNTPNVSVNVPYSTDGHTEAHDSFTIPSSTEPTDFNATCLTKKNDQPGDSMMGDLGAPTVGYNRTANATEKKTDGKTPTKVTELTPVAEGTDEKEKPDADISDISISKFSDVTNTTLSQHNITKTEYDTHQYYNSTFIIDETVGKKYWVDMDNHPELKVNHLLSQSHRRAATVKLKFDFPFYGHKVRNITIATGGFLYTGEYVHSWLAATQYIAPLMANFDTRLSDSSFVKYADNGTAFTVEWEKVVLQDKPFAGAFTFQVTLHQNGDIVFVYSVIPLMVEDIEETAHPVKVGLSDAYIMDRIVFFVRRKTIYEYHRVNFNRQDIKNWTVIYLHALPTCLEMDNCRDCLTKLREFDCKWCSELNQCSTGTFRSRQDWILKGCDVRKIKEVDNCPSATTTYKEHKEGYIHSDDHIHAEETITASEMSVKHANPTSNLLERSRDNMNMGVSGIIGILLVIAFVAALVGWAAYAYRNPHSASGQMLIRYRPSQWSWRRRGEARYTAATIHM